MNGKVVLITGATGEIGRATAFAFASRGARLVLVGRNQQRLADLKSELRAGGVSDNTIATFAANVADSAAVNDYFAKAAARFGDLDTVFNNAGIEGVVAPTVDYPDDVFDKVMNVNVRGVWLNLKAGIAAIRRSGRRGSIINNGSGVAVVAGPGTSAYSASKHAVIGLTRSAAVEVAKEGIRINAICPGPIESRMMSNIEAQSGLGSGAHAAFVANVPMGRYGTPREIAETVVFLASDAAMFMTGAVVMVDGGLTSR
jgi:NAD(P)-dependent dehydrogenase (short-subunit alcohol dehydrogenase family)